jgi:hypothetical protein
VTPALPLYAQVAGEGVERKKFAMHRDGESKPVLERVKKEDCS